METMTTEWVATDGVTHSVSSTRNVGETDAELEARHTTTVAAAQVLKPVE